MGLVDPENATYGETDVPYADGATTPWVNATTRYTKEVSPIFLSFGVTTVVEGGGRPKEATTTFAIDRITKKTGE